MPQPSTASPLPCAAGGALRSLGRGGPTRLRPAVRVRPHASPTHPKRAACSRGVVVATPQSPRAASWGGGRRGAPAAAAIAVMTTRAPQNPKWAASVFFSLSDEDCGRRSSPSWRQGEGPRPAGARAQPAAAPSPTRRRAWPSACRPVTRWRWSQRRVFGVPMRAMLLRGSRRAHVLYTYVVLVILYLHTQPPGLSPSPPPRLLSFNARSRVFVCLFLGFIFCDPIGSSVGCEERGEARVRMWVSEPHLLWGGCRRCSSYVLGGYRRPLPPHQWGVTPPIPTQAQAPQAR